MYGKHLCEDMKLNRTTLTGANTQQKRNVNRVVQVLPPARAKKKRSNLTRSPVSMQTKAVIRLLPPMKPDYANIETNPSKPTISFVKTQDAVNLV